mgnify:CR=1 FL=1
MELTDTNAISLGRRPPSRQQPNESIMDATTAVASPATVVSFYHDESVAKLPLVETPWRAVERHHLNPTRANARASIAAMGVTAEVLAH